MSQSGSRPTRTGDPSRSICRQSGSAEEESAVSQSTMRPKDETGPEQGNTPMSAGHQTANQQSSRAFSSCLDERGLSGPVSRFRRHALPAPIATILEGCGICNHEHEPVSTPERAVARYRKSRRERVVLVLVVVVLAHASLCGLLILFETNLPTLVRSRTPTVEAVRRIPVWPPGYAAQFRTNPTCHRDGPLSSAGSGSIRFRRVC